jgi:hypothetical protein
MIDTGTFIPVPFMLLMMLMTMFVEEENRQTEFNSEIIKYKRPEPEKATHLFAGPSSDDIPKAKKPTASNTTKQTVPDEDSNGTSSDDIPKTEKATASNTTKQTVPDDDSDGPSSDDINKVAKTTASNTAKQTTNGDDEAD